MKATQTNMEESEQGNSENKDLKDWLRLLEVIVLCLWGHYLFILSYYLKVKRYRRVSFLIKYLTLCASSDVHFLSIHTQGFQCFMFMWALRTLPPCFLLDVMHVKSAELILISIVHVTDLAPRFLLNGNMSTNISSKPGWNATTTTQGSNSEVSSLNPLLFCLFTFQVLHDQWG